jgi:hypothetical protein
MQLQRTLLRGAMVGGLLAMTGLVAPAPTTQAAGGDYGSCCTIIVNITPPSVTPPTVNPPVVNPPNVTPPTVSVNPPQINQTVPTVPVGGGGRSSVSSSTGSMNSVSPVSSSVSPVSISARPAAAAPPPAPPAPVAQVLGRTVEVPDMPVPQAVVPRPIIEETAPRVVAAPPPPEEVVAGRTVQREVCIPGVGGAGLGPNCGEVLGRTVQGPGLVMARVLPKAGEGQSNSFVVWPPLALAGAAAVLALVALVLPRRRPSGQRA